MKIKIVSYNENEQERTNLTINVLNKTDADFVVFSGHAISCLKDIKKLRDKLQNQNVAAVIDIPDNGKNHLYIVNRGLVTNMDSVQMFSTSSEISGNLELCNQFINELETKRLLRIKGKNILVLDCGENNILVNMKPLTPSQYVEFRINNENLMKSFEDILGNTDIIINPSHTLNSSQWLYGERAKYLSANNRLYCHSTNNNDLDVSNVQYAYFNSHLIMLQVDKEIYSINVCSSIIDTDNIRLLM